eukprot:765053-Hanusia_phi.AAC.1
MKNSSSRRKQTTQMLAPCAFFFREIMLCSTSPSVVLHSTKSPPRVPSAISALSADALLTVMQEEEEEEEEEEEVSGYIAAVSPSLAPARSHLKLRRGLVDEFARQGMELEEEATR